MTCYYCEFQFCWICGGTYSQDHFTALNPFGCSGQQFSSADPATSFFRFIWLYTRRLLILLGLLLVGPIVLALATPVFLTYGWLQCTKSCYRDAHGCCVCFFFLLTVPVVFAVGLALDIIVVPLAIVIGIPFFIIKQIMDKRETKRLARLRLNNRLQQAKELQT
jgi:E3 ubiquitin-protein ligase RNF19A